MSKSVSGKSGGPRNALDKAWGDISSFDLGGMAKRSGACRDPEGGLAVRFLGKSYSVLPTGRLVKRSDQKQVNQLFASLVLHYLMGAKDVELSGRLLTFRELEGGNVYYDAFYRRAILPLAQELGDQPEMLLERMRRVDGTAADLGNASARIPVFPRIPVVVVMWRGDEEVPSSANILFDSTAGFHLHTEDLAVIGGLLAEALTLPEEKWLDW